MYYMGCLADRLAPSPSPERLWRLRKGETILRHYDSTRRWGEEGYFYTLHFILAINSPSFSIAKIRNETIII